MEISKLQRQRAEVFRALHDRSSILVLANAWDVASAKMIAKAGAKAIATTSAGVANSLGYADGNVLPRDLAVAAVQRIARGVDLPVTADIEEGYGETAGAVCETIEAIIEAGAVGINIEDGRNPPDVLAERIAAIRERTAALGVPLFINARTDVYLLGLTSVGERLGETVRRARLYQEAGADGIFVPRLAERESIASLCQQVELPINLLAVPGLTIPAELGTLGVARLSAGSAIFKASLRFAEHCVQALLRDGEYAGLFESVVATTK